MESLDKKVRQSLSISSLSLAEYHFNRFSLRAADGEGSDEHKINMTLTSRFVGAEPDGPDGKKYSLAIDVSAATGDDSPFYEVDAEITGVFLANLPEDEAMELLFSSGVTELYNIAKMTVASMTSSGPFGKLMLPSITVDAHRVEAD